MVRGGFTSLDGAIPCRLCPARFANRPEDVIEITVPELASNPRGVSFATLAVTFLFCASGGYPG
jgi:hypothetical protein